MFDLIRLGSHYHLIPRGTAHTGILVCGLSREQVFLMGWRP